MQQKQQRNQSGDIFLEKFRDQKRTERNKVKNLKCGG